VSLGTAPLIAAAPASIACPNVFFFQSDEDTMHGAMDRDFWLQVSRPWLWWSSRPLGLRGCRGSVCLHGRLVHGNLGLCLPVLAAAPRAGGAGGFTTRSPAHGRLAGSAAVSCCRDRVVSAGTVPRRAPRPRPCLSFSLHRAMPFASLLAIICCGDS